MEWIYKLHLPYICIRAEFMVGGWPHFIYWSFFIAHKLMCGANLCSALARTRACTTIDDRCAQSADSSSSFRRERYISQRLMKYFPCMHPNVTPLIVYRKLSFFAAGSALVHMRSFQFLHSNIIKICSNRNKLPFYSITTVRQYNRNVCQLIKLSAHICPSAQL